jgi:hypothetical protein
MSAQARREVTLRKDGGSHRGDGRSAGGAHRQAIPGGSAPGQSRFGEDDAKVDRRSSANADIV